MWAGGRIAVALPLVVVACAALPDVPSNQCGNGVVESPEECDTFAPSASSVCRPAGAVGECRLDCTPRGDGTRPTCPAGWGCDSTNICQAPTGAFQSPSQSAAVGARSLLAGDFDGDGRQDILSRQAPDTYGLTTLGFHYFDDQGVLTNTRDFPVPVLSPFVADLDGDGRTDVVFNDSGAGLGLMLGRADRAWAPEPFGAAVQASDLQLMDIGDGYLVALATLESGPGVYAFFDPAVPLLAPLPKAGALVATGDVIEGAQSPCRELVVAFAGDTSFAMFDFCSGVDPDGTMVVRHPPLASVVDVPARIDAAPMVVDIDGDKHLDVLFRAGGMPYVAYGTGRGLATEATPYAFPGGVGSSSITPLAAGDFTGDGAVDFVFPDFMLISSPPGAFPQADESCTGGVCYRTFGLGHWTEAVIADLNRDGLPDVVAASASGLDFFNGTGTSVFDGFGEPTQYPASNLVVGDFDGDSINDLAFVEKDPSGENSDFLMMTFGARTTDLAAPVVVADMANTSQLLGIASPFAAAGELVAVSRESASAPTASDVFYFFATLGDKVPIASDALAESATSSGDFAIGLAAGRFTGGQAEDVLALATPADNPFFGPGEFWLVPGMASHHTSSPIRLEALDPRLVPYYSGGIVTMASASGDLDGDGRDEAIFAMPDVTGQQCGLVIAGVARATAPALARNETILLEQLCKSPQVLAIDADSDGARDIVIMTAGALTVLWNDGHGRFAVDDSTVIAHGAAPLAFAALAPTAVSPLRFAYVTDGAVWLVTASKTPRQFGAPEKLLDLQHGTGIAAGDFDGDGVSDLAVAASGNLMVLKAQLGNR